MAIHIECFSGNISRIGVLRGHIVSQQNLCKANTVFFVISCLEIRDALAKIVTFLYNSKSYLETGAEN
jgi:hypothetical protein